MDKLEKLLHDSAHAAGTEVAPAEGFQQVATLLEGKDSGKKSDKRKLLLLIFLGFVLSLCGYLVYDSTGGPGLYPSLPADAYANHLPASEDATPVTPPNNALKTKQQLQATSVALDRKERPSSVKTITTTIEAAASPLSITDLPIQSAPGDVVKQKLQASPPLPVSPEPLNEPGLTESVSPGGFPTNQDTQVYRQKALLPLPTLPINNGIVAQDLVAQGISSATSGNGRLRLQPLRRQNRVRKAVPSAYWSVGTSVYLVSENLTSTSAQLSTEPTLNDAIGDAYVIDGLTTTLYLDDFRRQEATRRRHPITLLNIRRQTNTSFFFGAGVSAYWQRSSNLRFARELAANDPDGFYGNYETRSTNVLAQATIGFTFLKRRRFQPWVCLDANYLVSLREYEAFSIIRDGSDVENIQFQLVQNTDISEYSDKLFPSLQSGVRGQVGRHWEVGLNVGVIPTGDLDLSRLIVGGVEVRYKLY